jgi:hypothetical protein
MYHGTKLSVAVLAADKVLEQLYVMQAAHWYSVHASSPPYLCSISIM